MPSASTSNVRVESVVLESALSVAAFILSALGIEAFFVSALGLTGVLV